MHAPHLAAGSLGKGQVVGGAGADAQIGVGCVESGQLRGRVGLRQEMVVEEALQLVAQVQSLHGSQICMRSTAISACIQDTLWGTSTSCMVSLAFGISQASLLCSQTASETGSN